MLRTLIVASPRLPMTGAPKLVALGGGGTAALYHAGQHYRAGVIRSPRFSARMSFDENGWTGGTLPITGTIVFAPAEASLLSELAGLYWRGAAITVQTGPEHGPFATRLTGKVADMAVGAGKLVLTIADLSAGIDTPLVTDRFAGSGGVEGVSEAAGRLKRRSLGRVFNVEGRIIDKANNIYEFGDPARPLRGFDALRDKGSAGGLSGVSWQGSIAATFAALQAASAPAGAGVAAPSIACAKWWTQPSGPLTADLRGETAGGYVEDVVGLAARVLAAAAGPPIANAVAAAAWRTGPAGVHIADENETAAQAIDRLLLGASLLWVLDPTGMITLRQISFADPVETLKPITSSRLRQLAPTRSRRAGYQRNHRLHADGEIAAVLRGSDVAYADGTLIDAMRPAAPGATRNVDRGPWSDLPDGASIVIGDEIQDQGSTWVAIADHAKASGNGPPALPSTANATWRIRAMKGAKGADGLDGLDGLNGADALGGYLTNESHTVAADSAGNVSSFNGAGGAFKVLLGTTDVTAGCTFAGGPFSPASDWSLVLNQATGVYAVVSMGPSVDAAWYDITATHAASGHSITRRFSLAKSKTGSAGQTGASAKTLTLSASHRVFPYSASNVPKAQTATLTAHRQNTAVGVRWFGYSESGSLIFDTGSNGSAGDSGGLGSWNFDVLTLTHIEFNAWLTGHGGNSVRFVAAFTDGGNYSDTVTFHKISDGEDGETGIAAFTGFLSNEAHTVAADSAGNVSSFSGADGNFKVFIGTTDVTAGCTFAGGPFSPASDWSLVLNQATGVYAVVSMGPSVDAAWYDITATHAASGQTITKRFSVTKSRAGAGGAAGGPGADAKLLYLASSRQIITLDSAGAVSPASQPIVFTASRLNTDAVITWTIYDEAGGTHPPNIHFIEGGSGPTQTMSAANALAIIHWPGTDKTTLKVVASLSDAVILTDTISVSIARDGADGSPAFSGLLSNDAHTLAADAAGNVSSFNGAGGDFKVFLGNADVTAGCTFEGVAFHPASDWSLTLNQGTGAYAVVSMGTTVDAAWYDIKATHTASGQTVIKRFSVTKTKQGAQGAPGNASPAAVYSPKSLSGPAPMTVIYPSQVSLANNVSISVGGYVQTVASAGAGGRVVVQVQFSPADAGAWVAASNNDGDYAPFEPTSFDISGSFTNVSGSTRIYDVRCVVTRTSPVTLDGSQSFFKVG